MAKRTPNSIGSFQPDLFAGEGIKRPGFGNDQAAELELAREEMMAFGAQTLFDYIEQQQEEE